MFHSLSTRPFAPSSILVRSRPRAWENCPSNHKSISPVHGDSRARSWTDNRRGVISDVDSGENILSKVLTVRRLLNRTFMIDQTEIVNSNVGLEFSANHTTYNNLKIRYENCYVIRFQKYSIVKNITLLYFKNKTL